MRIVFFGTPEFAVPALRRIAAEPSIEIPLVVTQPDRPAGRGRAIHRSPVGREADALGLPVYQPASLRDASARAPLDLRADLFVVAAFGLIFGPKTLALPRLGCLNVHASLLPRFRGASPIAAAILAGDTVTGVTLMRMDAGLDTGRTVATSREEVVRGDDTTETLTERLAPLGAELLPAVLRDAEARLAAAVPQPERGATLTRPLAKADGWLDWDLPADELERHVRAMWPWPRAWTTHAGIPVQVHRASVDHGVAEGVPGEVVAVSPLRVACGTGSLRLDLVQPAGSRPMTGPSFAAGRDVPSALVLGLQGGPDARSPIVVRG